MYQCALCNKHVCSTGELGNAPKNCPCNQEIMPIIKEMYTQEDLYQLAHISSLVTSQGYGKNTRLEEIIEFARACGYKKLGLAFCIGLSGEAKTLNKVLTHNGFGVVSVICKTGNIPKDFIDVKENVPVAMCNPIGQAILMNNTQTELNIILGLCVGHDSLFIKHSDAIVTTFAVKDRVLAHNPIAVLYQADSYYKSRLFPELD